MSKFARFMLGFWVAIVAYVLVTVINALLPDVSEHWLGAFFLFSSLTAASIWVSE